MHTDEWSTRQTGLFCGLNHVWIRLYRRTELASLLLRRAFKSRTSHSGVRPGNP